VDRRESGSAHHACRNQIEEFTAQQRGRGLRVELLMPGPAAPVVSEETAEPMPPPAPASTPAPSPGPDAEWFYLDTRPPFR
jgi:hypothetical protein